MTTIIGVKKNGEVYLASDSLGTSDGLQRDWGPKFIRGSNFAIAFSYSYRVAQIIEVNLHSFHAPIKWTYKEVLKFAEWLRKLLQKHGARKEAEKYEMVQHPVSLILGCKDLLFMIDCDYACFEVKDFIAEGSGRKIATGVLYALYGLRISTGEIATTTINAAAKFDGSTGGKVCLLRL